MSGCKIPISLLESTFSTTSSSMTSRWHLAPYSDTPMDPSNTFLDCWYKLYAVIPPWQGCFLLHWGKKGRVWMGRKNSGSCRTAECEIAFLIESVTSQTQGSSRWCCSTEQFPTQPCKSQMCLHHRETKTYWLLSTSKSILLQFSPFTLKVNLVGRSMLVTNLGFFFPPFLLKCLAAVLPVICCVLVPQPEGHLIW